MRGDERRGEGDGETVGRGWRLEKGGRLETGQEAEGV